jgi:hypothetical protein
VVVATRQLFRNSFQRNAEMQLGNSFQLAVQRNAEMQLGNS